jgi:hypothetical protein
MEHVFQLEVRKSGALLGHVRRDAKGFSQYEGKNVAVDVLDRGAVHLGTLELPLAPTIA